METQVTEPIEVQSVSLAISRFRKKVEAMRMNPGLQRIVAELTREFDQISSLRRAELIRAAQLFQETKVAGRTLNLLFLSKDDGVLGPLAQVWSWLALNYYCISDFSCQCAGLSAAGLHPETIKTMERAHFSATCLTLGSNPVYRVGVGEKAPTIACYSKRLDDPRLRDQFAVVISLEADVEPLPIPSSPNASRLLLPFEDPRQGGGEQVVEKAFDEVSKQIARELFFLFYSRSRN